MKPDWVMLLCLIGTTFSFRSNISGKKRNVNKALVVFVFRLDGKLIPLLTLCRQIGAQTTNSPMRFSKTNYNSWAMIDRLHRSLINNYRNKIDKFSYSLLWLQVSCYSDIGEKWPVSGGSPDTWLVLEEIRSFFDFLSCFVQGGWNGASSFIYRLSSWNWNS